MSATNPTTPLHVVFGGGQIGTPLARELRDLGLRVRVVRRSDRPIGQGIEVIAGDARDAGFAVRAASGAAVVYHCTNPQWERPFLVEDRRFRTCFPGLGRTLEEAIAETAALAEPPAGPRSRGGTRVAGVVAAFVTLLALAVGARAGTPSRDQASEPFAGYHRAPHRHADVEIDPTAYAASGYSLHAGIGYRRLRVDLGAFALRLPELFHGNSDYTVRMNGYGIKVQYFVASEHRGGFVGADAAVTDVLSQLHGTDMARRQRLVGLGVELGWRFALPLGFYATPWLGVSYNFNAHDVTLQGKEFSLSPVVIFPAVHLGFCFL